MKEELRNILIQKHLLGRATATEETELHQWRNANAANQKHFDQIAYLEKAMQKMDFDVNANTDQEWHNLQNELGLNETKVVTLKPRFSVLRIAAAFAFLVVAAWLFYTNFADVNALAVANALQTNKGDVATHTLSDGTKVTLNADSELSIYEGFNTKERRVALSGEAYFEVASNKNVPFIIETDKVNTTVLGTAFNILAYPEMETVEINVTEGIVEFADKDDKVRLTAEKAAKFQKRIGSIEVIPFEVNELAWQTGSLYFKNEPLSSVTATLERYFNINIENNSSSNRRIKEDVSKDDSIEDVLARIALAAGLKYELKNGIYYLKDK